MSTNTSIVYYTEEMGWAGLRALVTEELVQSGQEGKCLRGIQQIREALESTPDERDALTSLHRRLLELPIRENFPFEEPSDLEGIRRLSTVSTKVPQLVYQREELLNKLHGAWLGRCCGCALGKPVEGRLSVSWRPLRQYLESISPDEWPLRDYIPLNSLGDAPWDSVGCPDSTRDHIRFMETDDDIRYTVLGQILLQEGGRDFQTEDVARNWFLHLPYRQVCTAETMAYRNLVMLGAFWFKKDAQQKIDWNWVATHLNPYREWIGAQIRVDAYGYAAAGNPGLAAEFAWRDARMSHVKNGIYGAMFCAAMIAAAFVSEDPRQIVEAGLSQIPRTSRLYADIRMTIEICDRYGCEFRAFENVLDELFRALGHYSWVHTNNNAAVCVVALLLSGGDFHRGITLAVMGGWDTDCNGATVGSIVGAIAGAKRVPVQWSGRLNDTLNSAVIGYHPVSIEECARRSLEITDIVRGYPNH